MSQNIKKKLDSIDDKKTNEDLKRKIDLIQNKNVRLKLKVQKLEDIIYDQTEELSTLKQELPTDYKVLKDIIREQRKELYEKDKQINTLRELTQKFTTDLEKSQLKEKTLQFKLIDIPGIGVKTQEMLQKVGIMNANDLIRCDIEHLARNTKGLGMTRLRDWKSYLINRNKKLRNI